MEYVFIPELLKSKMVARSISVEKISFKLGINQATFYRKLSGSTEFDRSEMSVIRKELNLTPAEMDSIFFAKKLA